MLYEIKDCLTKSLLKTFQGAGMINHKFFRSDGDELQGLPPEHFDGTTGNAVSHVRVPQDCCIDFPGLQGRHHRTDV